MRLIFSIACCSRNISGVIICFGAVAAAALLFAFGALPLVPLRSICGGKLRGRAPGNSLFP